MPPIDLPTSKAPSGQVHRIRTAAAWTLIALAACSSSTEPDPEEPPEPGGALVLTEVATDLDRPTALASVPEDDRLFVAEQSGAIRIIDDGEVLATPFLDLSDRTTTEVERGLLGLTFHPDHPNDERFFVNHTDLAGNTRVVEFTVSPDDPNVADPGSEVVLLEIEQPEANHNGGDLEFGPDGLLYVSTGDGGGARDPYDNAQDVTTLHGGLLRLDVSVPGELSIPPDNPFADRPEEGAPELWAWGLRNPWRFSFDPVEGLLYIADVGQDRWEEVNVVPADEPGLNYGWPILEGPECLDPDDCAPPDDVVDPTIYYSIQAAEPCAIIGGAVYRAGRIPGAEGHYFYSDLCAGFVRSFRYENGEAEDETEWEVDHDVQVGSMGRDTAGELYLLTRDGRVLRLDPPEGP